mgnify:CR=1 FL=1
MKKFFTQGRLVTLVVAGVLIIDQLIKIAVKTNMYLHENIHVTDWFYIYFTENNGMAFCQTVPDTFPYRGCHIDYGLSGETGETDGQGEEWLPGLSFLDSGRRSG